MNVQVSVVVVNFNGQKWIEKFLKSVTSQMLKVYEIILVDNNSYDDSIAFIEENFPEVIIVKSEFNNGFGKACNIGVHKAKGNEILFLNTDTYFDKNLISSLLNYKKQKNINIVGARSLDYYGVDHAKGKFLSIDFFGYVGLSNKLFFIEGSVLLISKKDFTLIGGFDESYFMYSEDIDLCWRAMLLGMKIGISNESIIYHYGGGSSESTLVSPSKQHVVPYFRRFEVEKNNLSNLLKNLNILNILWIIPCFLMIGIGEALVYLLTGNYTAAKLIIKSYVWNMANIQNTIKKRRKIQSTRVIGDYYIMKKMTGFIPNKLKALISIGLPKFK